MKLFRILDTSCNMFEYYVVYANDEKDAIEKYMDYEINRDWLSYEYVSAVEIDPFEPILIASVTLTLDLKGKNNG